MESPKASRKQRPCWEAPDPTVTKSYEEAAAWRDLAYSAATAAELRAAHARERLEYAKSALEQAAVDYARKRADADKAARAAVVARCEQKAAVAAMMRARS